MIVMGMMLAVMLFAVSPVRAQNAVQEASMGPFTLRETPLPEVEGLVSLSLDYKGATLPLEEEIMAGAVAEAVTQENLPGAGCRTLVVPAFTGGAHCCSITYLAMQCQGQDLLFSVGLGHGSEAEFQDLNGDGTQELLIQDWSFAYYGPEGTDLSLSFAESLPFPRVFVFTGNAWRADRPGEFPAYYQALRTENEQEFTTADAGAAIAWTAMALMEGRPEQEVAPALGTRLPKDWRRATPRVLEDLKAALAGSGELCTALPLVPQPQPSQQ
ncbi:hypothetical protein [Megalodesulfovibrio paquesii]